METTAPHPSHPPQSPEDSPSSSPSTSTPSTSPVATQSSPHSYVTLMYTFTVAWFAGLLDALAFNRVFVIATKSPKIYKPILNCLFLNGVIFVGSYIVFHHIIAPLLQYEAVSWIFFVVYLFHTSIVIPLSKLALSHLSLSYPVLLRLSSPFGLFRSSSALYLFFTYVSFTAKDIMYVIQQRTNTPNHQNK